MLGHGDSSSIFKAFILVNVVQIFWKSIFCLNFSKNFCDIADFQCNETVFGQSKF